MCNCLQTFCRHCAIPFYLTVYILRLPGQFEPCQICSYIQVIDIPEYLGGFKLILYFLQFLFFYRNRIRSIETKGVTLVDEGIRSEFIAIVNYGIVGLIQLELGYAESADITNEEAMALYDKYAKTSLDLMLAKNHDYDEAWRSMRVSSYTDLILMKIYRTKQIESLSGQTLVSEGVDANYMDMINYSVFGLIKIEFGD